jgi:sugar phosphate isomerase/epimerase
MILGAQLYTVRHHAKDLDSFAETLKKVADIGYTTVQVSGTCDYEPEWLRDRLKETGLKCVLTHTKADKILADPAALCDAHKIFDCRNIGLGGLGKGFTDEKYAQFVSDFKSATETIVANGCKFFFHNHCEEFKRGADGKTYIDRMMEDFTPDQLNFTLDTYWVQYAGCDPCDTLRALKGRLECIHLKDMRIDPTDWTHLMAPVGYGNMNFEKIIDTAGQCDVKYMLVEQDKCYDEDPFECLKKSYEYVRSLGIN